MTQQRQLPIAVRSRVIVDNDWAGDPDGLVALAHHLLSPANRVDAITSSFIDPAFGVPGPTAEQGSALARELVGLVGGEVGPPVHTGSEVPFSGGEVTTAAADAIVQAARSDDPLPLYVVCGGPLTNVACALRTAPDAACRFTLVWIGGTMGAESFEYNRDTDLAAFEYVFEQPGLDIEQFPLETYRRCAYTVAELEHELADSGRLGQWLWTRFLELDVPDWLKLPEVWPLGDSPPILVTALGVESSARTTTASESGRGSRRVFTDIDMRLIVGDLMAKLRRHERRRFTGN